VVLNLKIWIWIWALSSLCANIFHLIFDGFLIESLFNTLWTCLWLLFRHALQKHFLYSFPSNPIFHTSPFHFFPLPLTFLLLKHFFLPKAFECRLRINLHCFPHSSPFFSALTSTTTGVDFTNILQTDFTSADPKSTKKTTGLNVFFALLGSAHIKAAHKMLVKLTTGKMWRFRVPLQEKSENQNHYLSVN